MFFCVVKSPLLVRLESHLFALNRCIQATTSLEMAVGEMKTVISGSLDELTTC